MFKRKLPVRILHALWIFAVLTALDALHCLLLLLVVTALAVNIAKALPASWLESADHDMVAARYICAVGMGGEWKHCASGDGHD